MKRVLAITMSLVLASLVLVGCGVAKEEETTVVETTEEPTTTLSDSEAITIAEEELASRLDGDDTIYDWNLYKDSKVEGANIVDDSEDIIEVDMYVEIQIDWSFMGGTITSQQRLYACGINKYTGEVVSKEPENFWEEQ